MSEAVADTGCSGTEGAVMLAAYQLQADTGALKWQEITAALDSEAMEEFEGEPIAESLQKAQAELQGRGVDMMRRGITGKSFTALLQSVGCNTFQAGSVKEAVMKTLHAWLLGDRENHLRLQRGFQTRAGA